MGATFKEIWESWLEVSLSEPANDELEERRHAFYAGGIAMMSIFLDVKDTPEDIAYIRSLRRELERHTLSLLGN